MAGRSQHRHERSATFLHEQGREHFPDTPRISEAERIAARLFELQAKPRKPRPAPTIRRFSWQDTDQ